MSKFAKGFLSPLMSLMMVFAVLFATYSTGISPASAACTERYVILLQGWNTTSDTHNIAFDPIINNVLKKDPFNFKDDHIIPFNYRDASNLTKYDDSDTFKALPKKGLQILHQTIKEKILDKCSDAYIDLIGHSLGGAIAFFYLKDSEFKDTNEARHVKHVITLDSPVNGASAARLLGIAEIFGNKLPNWNNVLISDTGKELKRLNEDSNTVKSNVTAAFDLRNAGRTVVRNIASTDDNFVSHADAEIRLIDVNTGAPLVNQPLSVGRFHVELSLGNGGSDCAKNAYRAGFITGSAVSTLFGPIAGLFGGVVGGIIQAGLDLYNDGAFCFGHNQVLKDGRSHTAIKEALLLEPMAGKMDLIFTIDSTGSMDDDIAAAQAAANQIVNIMASRVPDFRFALVDYKDFPPPAGRGDPGDYPAKTRLAFTSDKATIVAAINALSTGGGGDVPESVFTALVHSILDPSLSSTPVSRGQAWRPGVSKQVVLIGDAPPHNVDPVTGFTRKDAVEAAFSVDPAVIQAVVIGNNASALREFTALASATGGRAFTAASADQVVAALIAAITEATLYPLSTENSSVRPASVPTVDELLGRAGFSSTQPIISANNDAKEDEKPKETEEERQQRQHTNRSGKADVHTEGNVIAVEKAAGGKSLLVTIALVRNETLVVQAPCFGDAANITCPDIQVGDYLEADGYQNGVGDPNSYFVGDNVTVLRNGKKVK